ncbi:MAG: hypothetical protein N2039_01175 [Gemmataceae bacterium]|nr:hypothetical protein [Gemmataceae bacterium]
MVAFIIALICVGLLRAYAFRGTNPAEFVIDIILLIFLTGIFRSCV